MKKVFIAILMVILIVSCSYPKNYRDYYYDGGHFLSNGSEEEYVHIQCVFYQVNGLSALKIFQLDDSGEAIPGAGTDLVFYTQDKEHLRFTKTNIIFQNGKGEIIEETIDSGIIGEKHIMLFGFMGNDNPSSFPFYRGEKNILSKYFD